MVRLERGFVTGLSCAASACARARGCCACTHGLTPLAVYIYILLIVRARPRRAVTKFPPAPMAGRGDEGVVQLLAGLPARARQLRLPSRGITGIGAAAIGAAIGASGSAVHSLSLERNQLGDDGALALAAAVPKAPALTSLALGDNHIGPDGLTALLQALETSRVREVDLGSSLLDGRRHNRLCTSETAIGALARCVAGSNLTQLNLRGCGLNHCCEELCVHNRTTSLLRLMQFCLTRYMYCQPAQAGLFALGQRGEDSLPGRFIQLARRGCSTVGYRGARSPDHWSGAPPTCARQCGARRRRCHSAGTGSARVRRK